MNLTDNFTLEELVKSETALRHNIDNTPGEIEIENLKRLCSTCGNELSPGMLR